MTPKILVLSGSIRTGSFNTRLAGAATMALVEAGAQAQQISLADFAMPILDQDLEKRDGVPEKAMELGRFIAAAHGAFLASPEYNASIPPLLKNAVDWVSRIGSIDDEPVKPWRNKIIALGSASNGALGGIRGLYHLRAVMMNVGAEIITAQCAVSGAADAFDDEGRLKSERAAGMLDQTCRTLVRRCRQMSAG